MASGVGVADEVIEAFDEIKMKRQHKFVMFKISDDLSEIVIDHKSNDADYSTFLGLLPAEDCRYALYDVEFEVEGGGKRAKLMFIVWCPDIAKIKPKMMYAASKDALKKKLNGIHKELQATEFDEIDYDALVEAARSV